jgi:MarR family transcriptional regulator for hemolysin
MQTLTPDERHDFAREIAVVARRWRTRLDERLKDLNMSQARWVALYWLGQHPEGISQAALADLSAVEPPTLLRVVDQLEQQGLIERRPEPNDRRIKRLCLTEAAIPVVEAIGVIAEDMRQEVMGDITLDEFHNAMSVLRRIRTRLA